MTCGFLIGGGTCQCYCPRLQILSRLGPRCDRRMEMVQPNMVSSKVFESELINETRESPISPVLHSCGVLRRKYLLQHHWELPMEQTNAKIGGVLPSWQLVNHCYSPASQPLERLREKSSSRAEGGRDLTYSSSVFLPPSDFHWS